MSQKLFSIRWSLTRIPARLRPLFIVAVRLAMLVAALVVTQTALAAPVINGDFPTGNESPWRRWQAPWGGPYTWQISSSGPTPPEGTLSLGLGSYGWFQRVAVTPGLEYSLVGDWAGDIGGAGWVEFMLFTGTEGQADGEIIHRIDVGNAADVAYKKDSWGMNPPTAWDWEPAFLSPHPDGNGGVIQAVGGEIVVALKLGSGGGGGWASFDNIELVTAVQPEICGNGLDDDDDGYIDGYDPDCSGPPVCMPPTPPVFSIQQAWASTQNVAASMAATVGDLDGDGDVEIIAPLYNGTATASMPAMARTAPAPPPTLPSRCTNLKTPSANRPWPTSTVTGRLN